MVLAADNLRDPHVDVVADDAQVVERAAVRPEEREILDVRVLPLLDTVDAILEARDPAVRHLEADRERFLLGTLRGFGRAQQPAALVAPPGTPRLLRRL